MTKKPKRCALRKRRALFGVLAILMTAAAVAAAIQVFMYAAWTATIRVPEVKWAAGNDNGQTIGGYQTSANITTDGETATLALSVFRSRRQLISDLLRVQNGFATAENITVGCISGSYSYENAGPYTAADIDNITVYLGADNTEHTMSMGVGGILSFNTAPTATLLSVDDNVPTYSSYNTAAWPANTWRSIVVYIDLGSGVNTGDNIEFEMDLIHGA